MDPHSLALCEGFEAAKYKVKYKRKFKKKKKKVHSGLMVLKFAVKKMENILSFETQGYKVKFYIPKLSNVS